MLATSKRNTEKHGGPPFRRPHLILVYGVAYYRDYCQWSSEEMRQVQMRSEREVKSRIFLQVLSNLSGFYTPLNE